MRSNGLFQGEIEVEPDGYVRLEILPSPDFWVRTGRTDKQGVFTSSFFDLSTPPKAGDALSPRIQVSLRAFVPFEKLNGWSYGNDLSYLQPGLVFHIDRIGQSQDASGDSLHWAGGRVFRADDPQTDVEQSNWYVVVTWDRTVEGARDAMEELQNRFPDTELDLEIFWNSLGYFVVASGGGLTQTAAKARLLELKCSGVSDTLLLYMGDGWKKAEATQSAEGQ
jgi:hypothetical protein